MFHVKQFTSISKDIQDLSGRDPYISTRDYFLTGEEFQLFKHSDLDMLYTIPQPTPDELSAYYDSNEYISHQDDNKGLVAWLYRRVRNFTIRKKIRLIEQETQSKGSLADLGAGTGTFLERAKNKGWKVTGVEPNPDARQQANEKGIVLKNSIAQLEGQQFDVVTLWHVLEHLPDLEDALRRIKELVKPGGTLVIAVPNFKSFDARYYGEFWAAYDTPRHLWHFSKSSMIQLLKPDMEVKSIRPMWFDSFYVSLLSEKYKTGSSSLIKAIWTGLRSNLIGLSNGEYSSLQYCFKKPEQT